MVTRLAVLTVLVGLMFGFGRVLHAEQLTVHEWGTFTALQDEQGRALGGINVDDEPLPAFVHDLNPLVVGHSYSLAPREMIFSKGIPDRHPFVTLRLETPVIYFHLPRGSAPVKLDVGVALRGGWLTQFYPKAEAEAPGVKASTFNFGPITPQTVGRLSWTGLTVGTDGKGPKTDQHVWAAPRNVRAANVTTGGKSPESEKYLFYRGVGNFAAPLEVATDAAKDRIKLHARFENVLAPSEHLQLGPLWLVQVEADGRFAYRTLAPVNVTADRTAVVGQARASFDSADFAVGNLDNLRGELRQALVREGLFPDEAAALVETWNQPYFRAPGLRLFFLVPRRWTDHYLPLSISVPAELERAMIGRIELIGPQQRAGLKRLAEMAVSNPNWMLGIYKSKNAQRFLEGHGEFADLGIPIPADYQAYLDLGRFRNAMVLDAERRHPSPSLAKFIAAYSLSAYTVPSEANLRE